MSVVSREDPFASCHVARTMMELYSCAHTQATTTIDHPRGLASPHRRTAPPASLRRSSRTRAASLTGLALFAPDRAVFIFPPVNDL
jgi:hypothetical protein